jgi:hypothetical protein
VRPDVQELLGNLSRQEANQLGKRDYVRALESLPESEAVRAILPVVFQGARGSLVVTGQRLAFLSGSGQSFSAPIADVYGVRTMRLGFMSRKGVEIYVQVGSGEAVFGSSTSTEETVSWFLGHLDDARTAARAHAAGSSAPIAGGSLAGKPGGASGATEDFLGATAAPPAAAGELFVDDGKPRSVLPVAITSALREYGMASLQRRGGAPMDERFGWEYVGPVINGLGGPEREAIVAELWEIGNGASDSFLTIGAYTLLAEGNSPEDDPRFILLRDAVLNYLQANGYSSGHLNRYEADRWTAIHGDLRTSFDGIVEVDLPSADKAAPIPELAVGENKLLALTEALPAGNAFYAERQTEDRYIVFSERSRSDDDPTRERYDETYLGTFSSLHDLYLALGKMFGTRPHWADASVDPYFPAQRS